MEVKVAGTLGIYVFDDATDALEFARAFPFDGGDQRIKHSYYPGQNAEQQDRDEVVPRLVSLVYGRRVALQVFVHEKKLWKLRICERNSNKPWRTDGKKKHGADRPSGKGPKLAPCVQHFLAEHARIEACVEPVIRFLQGKDATLDRKSVV